MIKANQLRIGNYFNFYPIGHDLITDKVIALKSEYKEGWYRIKGEKSGWNQESQCHPIPLTPDILEMCGFEKFFLEGEEVERVYTKFIKTTNNYTKVYLSICIDENLIDLVIEPKEWIPFSNDFTRTFINLSKGGSLHQLQNLYWCLTGTELNVNLHVETAK